MIKILRPGKRKKCNDYVVDEIKMVGKKLIWNDKSVSKSRWEMETQLL